MPPIGIRSYFGVVYIECELLEVQNTSGGQDTKHLWDGKPLQVAPWIPQVSLQYLRNRSTF